MFSYRWRIDYRAPGKPERVSLNKGAHHLSSGVTFNKGRTRSLISVFKVKAINLTVDDPYVLFFNNADM